MTSREAFEFLGNLWDMMNEKKLVGADKLSEATQSIIKEFQRLQMLEVEYQHTILPEAGTWQKMLKDNYSLCVENDNLSNKVAKLNRENHKLSMKLGKANKDLEILEIFRHSLTRVVKPYQFKEIDTKDGFVNYMMHQETEYIKNQIDIKEQQILTEWVIENIDKKRVKEWLKDDK